MPHRATEVELQLKPSVLWLLFTLLGGVIAIVASVMLTVLWLRITLAVVMVVYVMSLLKRYFWRIHSTSVYGVRYRGGRWWVRQLNGSWSEVCIKEPVFMSAFVTILLFSRPSSSFCAIPVAIFRDSANSDDYRRLRVLLRFNPKNHKK